MRVIGIIGLKDTGKTNLICDILKNLKDMDVATVKNTYKDIYIDKEGTDSYKHKQYSNVAVFSTNKQTAFFYDRLSLEEILSKLDNELVIIEGFKEQLKDLNIPKILIVKDDNGLDLEDSQTIMVIKDYKYDIDEVVKNVLEKAVVPTYNLNCGHCGHNCKIFVEKVVNEELRWDRCVLSNGIKITVNGKTIPANPFVSKIIKNAIKGIVSSLKGADDPKSISIIIENEK